MKSVTALLSLISIILNVYILKRGKKTQANNNSICNPNLGYNVQEFYDPNGKLVFSRHWCDLPSEDKNIDIYD